MSVDVLIGQAYYLRFDPALERAGKPYAPLGSLYAAAVARESGYSVAVFDSMLAGSVSEWEAALDEHRPSVAVLFEDNFNYLSKMCLSRMRDAACAMTQAASRRRIPVVVSGSDPTDHPSIYASHGASVVIVGEGEAALVDVLQSLLRDGRRMENIAGLALPQGSQLLRTVQRQSLRDLDALPRPAWDAIDIERYRAVWLSRHGYFSMNVSTTRGCPYHCNWCAKPIYGQRYAARSARSMAEEIAWLKRVYRPDHLWITDDIFGLKPGWVAALSQDLIALDAVVPFKCLMRADGIDADVVQALRDAGCNAVWIGAESGSQRVLDAMDKGTRVEQVETAARLLKTASIEVGFFLQFGYPGETFDDIEQTIAMVDRCGPDDIGVSVTYPLPGTPLFDRVRSQRGAKQNWVDSSDLAMMYPATYPPDFYRALHRYVHARFRIRRASRRVAQIIRKPSDLTRADLTFFAGAARMAAGYQLHAWLLWHRARASKEAHASLAPVLRGPAHSAPGAQET